jgi:CHAD domain-containing protein
MRLEASDLDLPDRLGVRALLRAHLRETLGALAQLERSSSGEALHDFRVSLRRLRSLARALNPVLRGELRKKQLRRLGAFAGATGEARDAEVFLGHLTALRGELSPRDAGALDQLAARLSEGLGGGHGQVARRQLRGFRKLARGLDEALAEGAEADEALDPRRTLARALADCIEPQAAELAAALAEVRRPFDVEQAHAARIAAKRLRYLLEPLRGCPRADSAPAIAALRELQDRLGEMHDAHVLGEVVLDELVAGAEARARQAHAAIQAGRLDAGVLRLASRDPRVRGLLAVDARVAGQAARAFDRLQAEWRPARQPELAEAVAGLCAALSRRGAAAAQRRAFLLLRVPASLGVEPAARVELGWRPGPAPRTRLVSTARPDGGRSLLEEPPGAVPGPVPDDQAEARWAETREARLASERRVVRRGQRQWVLDSLGPKGPVLVETTVERGEALRLPRWLASEVVREVTDEAAYGLERLARRRGGRPPEPQVDRAFDTRAAAEDTVGDEPATDGQLLPSESGDG